MVRHEVEGGLDRRVVEIDGRGRHAVADGEQREDRFDRAGRAEKVAGGRLGRGHRHLARGVAEQPLDGLQLDLVAHLRRGAVGVDVVDVVGGDPGALHRHPHAALGAVAILGRRRDVIGVAREAVADDLAIDLRAAGERMLALLEDDDAGALADDEAVAVAVIGSRRLGRTVVEVGRERPAGGEARDRQPVDRRLGAAGDHDVGVAERDQPGRIADGMGRRSSRRSPPNDWAP